MDSKNCGVWVALFLAFFLSACGGGSETAPSDAAYTIGGSVAGLRAGKAVVLRDRESMLTLSENGPFTFPASVIDGARYLVSVDTQPAGQRCTVSNGAGTVSGANVSNVIVACVQTGGAIQDGALSLAGGVSTFAGTPFSQDGLGSAANFNGTRGGVVVGGSLYVPDPDSHTIRRIALATGEVTTFAGRAGIAGSGNGNGTQALFIHPFGIATDGTNLYVVDKGNHLIRRIVIGTGEVTTFAGSGEPGSADGVGAAASFNYPGAIASDGTSLYIADTFNLTIRRVVIETALVSTLAGTADSYGHVDAIGEAASFWYANGIATDGKNVYVADSYNQTIRKIDIGTREVSTLAGAPAVKGSEDGIGANARFRFPYDVATDGAYVYVADRDNHAIRRIDAVTAEVTTLAGMKGNAGSANGTGTAARFHKPHGLALDGAVLYVGDSGNRVVRAIGTGSGEVTTLAGTPAGTDGIGVQARFQKLAQITTDGIHVYSADLGGHTIRKTAIATGETTTLAGTAGIAGAADGIGAQASFTYPAGITTDGVNVYVADTNNHIIRKIAMATGEVTTLADKAGMANLTDGVGEAARFFKPAGITTDGTSLYVADTNNSVIRRVVIATGETTTFAGRYQGMSDGIGDNARFLCPYGITTDGVNLYVADSLNHSIRQIEIATRNVTTLTGTSAPFNTPLDITTDGVNLYVSDTYNHTVRKIVIATGEVTTLAGAAGVIGTADGLGAAASFHEPYGITTDGKSLYINDSANGTIRRIE